MPAATDIFSALFGKVDALGVSAVQTLYQQLATSFTPVFLIGLTIYVAFWGYEMLFGRAPITAGVFFWRIFRLMIIYTMALSWSDFQATVVTVLSQTPNDIASAVCSAVGGTNCSSGDSSVSQGLTNIWTAAAAAAKAISDGAGWTGVSLMILSYIILAVMGLFVAYAAYLIILGKMALFILLSLAPIFISMAIFGISSHVFDGWMRACVQYAIVPVIVYGFLGFFIVLLQGSLTKLSNAGGATPDMSVIGPVLVMTAIGMMLLTQTLHIAAVIAGGQSLRAASPGGVGRFWAAGARNVWRTGTFIGAGVVAGVRGASASGSGNTMSGSNVMGRGQSAGAAHVSAAIDATRT